jgi:hypothetical protein
METQQLISILRQLFTDMREGRAEALPIAVDALLALGVQPVLKRRPSSLKDLPTEDRAWLLANLIVHSFSRMNRPGAEGPFALQEKDLWDKIYESRRYWLGAERA